MKKTLITVVRHGETEWNVAMRLQGIQDSDLTAKGVRQVEKLAETITNEDFDVMVSSDLGRALQTSEIIASKTGLSYIRDASLRERNFGIMEGLTREEISSKYPEVLAAYYKRKATYKVEKGESLNEFNARVIKGLFNIEKFYKGKKILIVAHGGVLDCIIRMVFSYPLSSTRCFTIFNTAINVFSVVDNKWTLEEWGNIKHLDKADSLNEYN